MDLRSIVNAEDTPDARKIAAANVQSPSKEDTRPPSVPHQHRGMAGAPYETRVAIGPEHHEGRPSYPPPIRTVSYNDPYPQSASPSAMVKQNFYSMMRPNVDATGPHVYHERGSASSSQGHHSFSTPLTRTPTGSSSGSAGAYSVFQRPTSSHSARPGSAHFRPPNPTQRSPQSANTHARLPSQPQTSQQHPSQPHTPLGPPSGRPSYNASQDSPGPYGHQRTYSNESYGQQRPADPSVSMNKSSLAHSSRPSHAERVLSAESRAREQSLSVSPKTRIDSLPVAQTPEMGRQHVQALSEQTAPPRAKAVALTDDADMSEPEIKPLPRRSTSSFAIGGLLNQAPASDRIQKNEVVQGLQPLSSEKEVFQKSSTPTYLQTQKPPLPSRDQTPSKSNHRLPNSTPALVPKSGASSDFNQPSVPMEGVSSDSQPSHTYTESHDRFSGRSVADHPLPNDALSAIASSKYQPTRKKPRLEDKPATQDPATVMEGHKMPADAKKADAVSQAPEKRKRRRLVPIFAQSVRHTNLAVNGNSRLPSKEALPGVQPVISDSTSTALPTAQINGQSTITQEANSNMQTNGTYVPIAQPERDVGPLGSWEPSILDIQPTEDITKVISDWLFVEVVQKQGIGVGPAGGSANKGAVLEVEAKIGRLIDQNTNDRLRLPVISECVISQSDPNMRIAFESSMTEPQHRAMNGFLNKAVQDSLQKVASATTAPHKKRIPIRYHHTYETDRFYELSQQGLLALPLAITDCVEARHKRKTTVRTTHDQKTGRELAKIVKARLADINVYSPRTLFDYRISVNVEMNFEGNMGDLIEPERARGGKPDRNKDRMSYTHLAYQIDLTQVTPTEGSNKAEKEHELEIEVSSEEVRRQGLLAMNGQDHDYDKLVRGFLDNVRVLARHCQPHRR